MNTSHWEGHDLQALSSVGLVGQKQHHTLGGWLVECASLGEGIRK